jgi:hypothetical protein
VTATRFALVNIVATCGARPFREKNVPQFLRTLYSILSKVRSLVVFSRARLQLASNDQENPASQQPSSIIIIGNLRD